MYYVLLLKCITFCCKIIILCVFFLSSAIFDNSLLRKFIFMGTEYNNGMSFGFVVILSSNEPFKNFIWYISKFSEANMRWLCIWLQVHVNSVCFKFKMYEKQTKQSWRIIIPTMLNPQLLGPFRQSSVFPKSAGKAREVAIVSVLCS